MNKPLASGQTIVGRYRLLRPLGRGGSGNVWLAQDLLRDRRQVAFKSASLPDDELSSESLRQEFRVLTQLLHPHLVRVFDTGVLPDGGRYLTEEHVDGETLWSLSGRLPAEFVEPIFVQLLRALDYLHRRKVIHGDIQPANVILQWRIGRDGQRSPIVKLVDFGLAHTADGAPRSVAGGTHAFMAPEVRLARSPDVLSELFSLAATIYAVVTAKVPFPSKLTPQQFLMQPPPDFSEFGSQVPDAVRGVLRRMLSVSREGRYTTPREALDDLVFRSGGRISIASLETAPSYLHGGALVGRLELFEELRRRHTAGPARMVLVGAAGLGKSRLARELEVQAQLDGANTFRHRVAPANVPYAAAAALADQIVSQAGEVDDDEAFIATDRRRARGISSVRHSFAPALLAGLERVATLKPRPVVIIEDIDLADEWSLRLFEQWASSPADFTLVATAQNVPSSLGQAFHAFEVGPLTREEVQRFLHDRFGEVHIAPSDLQHLMAASAGAPGRLREICADLLERGMLTPSADESVWTLQVPTEGLTHEVALEHRLSGLSPRGRQVLALLSLLQRPIDDTLLLDLLAGTGAALQPMELWGLLRDLERRAFVALDRKDARLLIGAPGERVGKVLRGELSGPEAAVLHGEIGRALGARWLSRGGVEAREVAFHLHRAGRHDDARNFEFIAADDAIGVGAIERALEHLDWAVRGSISQEEEAYVRLREVLQALRVGDVLRAEDSCREAVDLAGKGYVAALAQSILVRSALDRGELTLARAAYTRLTRGWPSIARTYLVEKVRAELARAIGRLDESLAANQRCVSLARSRGWRTGALAAQLQVASGLLVLGDIPQADRAYETLLTNASLHDTLGAGRRGLALAEWGKVAMLLGDTATARARLGHAHDIVSATRAPRRIAEVLLHRVEFELLEGDPGTAARWLDRLRGLRTEVYSRVYGYVERGYQQLIDAHHPSGALHALAALERAASRQGGAEMRAATLLHLGWGFLIAGDETAAQTTLHSLLGYLETLPYGRHVTGTQARLLLERAGLPTHER